MQFFRAGDSIFAVAAVRQMDLSEFERKGWLWIRLDDGSTHKLDGVPALEALMRIFPAAVEGARFRFRRHAWAFHNLVAHPLLQLLVWIGKPQLGMKIHDGTVPTPTILR
jgi:hypothetical protein